MDARTGVIVLLCLIGLTLEEMVEFKSCSSSHVVSSVDIVPCTTEPCHLHRGHSYTVSVTFTSAVESRTSKAAVHGIVVDVAVPWPIPQEDGCKSGIHCSIQKKKTYTYVGTLTVKPKFPKLKLDVQWELRGDDYKALFCIVFPVQIVN